MALDSEDLPASQQLPQDAPVLILLPGLTGGSEDSYVQHAVVGGWVVLLGSGGGLVLGGPAATFHPACTRRYCTALPNAPYPWLQVNEREA